MNKYSAAHLVEQEIASKQTRGKAGCKSIMYFSSSAAFGQQNVSQWMLTPFWKERKNWPIQ